MPVGTARTCSGLRTPDSFLPFACGTLMASSSPPRVAIMHESHRVTRRELLRIGGTSVMGVALSRLLAAAETSDPRILPARADALIVLFLNGGPSHIDMWDMKPQGPAETRGEFKPVDSSQPGVQVCEHLPRLSRQMHHAALVRSMHHSVNNAHALAVYTALTGHDRGDANRIVSESGEDHPAPGAVAGYLRPTPNGSVPYVALPYKTKEGAGGPPQPGFFGGWLGKSLDPLWVLKDPNAADFSVPELTLQQDVSIDRLAERGLLLARLKDRWLQEAHGATDFLSGYQHQAIEILTSRQTQAAFRLDQEPAAMREAYGRNIYGQSTLLARRLIEAGTRVVTLSWAPDANATWDTHGGNFKKLKDTLLPQFDAACGTLLQDLHDRGLLERTLVAVLGDFGRTPKINGNDAGRDHWNYCYTIMLAGGGIRPGFVYGASDKQGAFPADRPTTPGDVLATIYQQLGIDARSELYDRVARPHRIVPKGDVISDLLA